MADDDRITSAQPARLDEVLLQAIRTAGKRGGPCYVSITNLDGTVFSGGINLTVVAETFLALTRTPDSPAPSVVAKLPVSDPDSLRTIHEAVSALAALRHG